MADPITWAAIGTMVVGTAMTAKGQMDQGKAAANAAQYNRDIAERQASLVPAQVESQVQRQRYEAAQTQGSLLAGYGASGVSTDEGSPLDVLRMSVTNAKLDELNIRYQGELKKMGYAESAGLYGMQGEAAQRSAAMSATGTLLSGIGQAGVGYKTMNRPNTLSSAQATLPQ